MEVERQRYLTTTEAAALLRLHQDTVVDWCAAGRLRGRKVGRRWLVLRASVDGHLAGLNDPPPPALARVRSLLPQLTLEERLVVARECLTPAPALEPR